MNIVTLKIYLSVALLITLFFAQAPAAESTRDLRQLRQQKLSRLQSPPESKLENFLYWFEKEGHRTFFTLNYKHFYPKFTSLSTGSGFAPGVRYWNPDVGGSFLDIKSSAAYSLRSYQLYDFQVGNIKSKGSEFFLSANNWGGIMEFDEKTPYEPNHYFYVDIRFRHFPQEDFFGVGPDSAEQDRTDFLLEDTSYELAGGYQLHRHIGLGIRAGLLQPDISRGTDRRYPDTQIRFNEASAPGLSHQPDFLIFNSSIIFDYRDIPGNPHRGGMAGFSFTRFDDRDGSEFDFNRYAVDLRNYLPLGSKARVLATRVFASFDDTQSGSAVPFYLMETLGGSETLRGFREFRFRDKNLFYLSAEYRWEAAPAWELAVFYDAGKVFADRSDLDFNDLRKNWGFGVRFKTSQAVFLRFDFAGSTEGKRFFFNFGPSF